MHQSATENNPLRINKFIHFDTLMFAKRIVYSITLTIASLLAVGAMAQPRSMLRYEQRTGSKGQVCFELGAWRLRNVVSDGQSYQTIDMNATGLTERKGWAELPYVNACLQLGAQTQATARIVECDYDEIDLQHPLLPSRGVIYRSQNPDTIPYRIAPESMLSSQYPETAYELGEPFTFRNERGINLRIYPFCYNAKQQKLRIYRRIVVEIAQRTSTAAVNPLKHANAATAQNVGMYKSMFLNYTNASKSRALPVNREYGDILVIATQRDSAAIMPYVQWKREKGFGVTITIVPTGSYVTEIIRNAYNSNRNLMFVQLVGDWGDIKGNTHSSAPADPSNGCVDGNDNYPDIAIGRFSCSSPEELTAQVNKTINYERNPDDSNWYATAIGIASNEGGANNGDNSESDITHIERIWQYKLQPAGYTTYHKLYQGQTSTSVATLTAAIEEGASIINYTGHGSSSSFLTTGFSTKNAKNLNNGSKLPIIFATACVVGRLSDPTCFAEAWLRNPNGGAVGTFMSSINQPWAPPMRGQDYFNDLLTGGYDYTINPGEGISTDERRTLLGSIHINGIALMLSDYGSSGVATSRTWNLFGDASLQVRTARPAMLVSSDQVIWIGLPFRTTLTANGQPVANAQVCASQNGRYISGYTNANGEVELNTSEFEEGKALLVATAFNTTTIYQEVDVRQIDGAFIRAMGINLNHDGQLMPGRNAQAKIMLKNIGQSTSEPANISITSQSDLLEVRGTASIGAIAPGETVEAEGFELLPDVSIADEQYLPLRVTATANEEWTSSIIVTAHKPQLQYVKAIWLERLGESSTMQVQIEVANTGSHSADNVEVQISTGSELVTGIDPVMPIATLAPQEHRVVTFTVHLADWLTADDAIPFDVQITSGMFSSSGTFVLSNTCVVKFDLFGSKEYNDGWHNNYLHIHIPNIIDTSITLTETMGYTNSFAIPLPMGMPVTVSYLNTGLFADEHAYTVAYNDGMQIAHTDAGKAKNSQFTFICLCSCNAEPPTPPSAPEVQLTHQLDTDLYTAQIAWENTAPSALYNIYCNNMPLTTPTSDTAYVHNNMAAEALYSYSVSTITCRGESPRSISTLVSTKECRAPANIEYNYKFVSSSEQHILLLRWNKSSASDISYTVFRNDTLIAHNITTNEYRDTVYAGHLHYRIRSNCDDVASSYSNNIELTIRPCSWPTEITAKAVYSPQHKGTVVRLDWTGEPNQIFRVLRNQVVIAQHLSNTTFIDTTAIVGETYKYKVQAQCGAMEIDAALYQSTSLSSDTYTITVEEQTEESQISSVQQNTLQNLKVYPNPTRNTLWIEAETALVHIALFNMLGEQLRNQRLSPSHRHSIDLGGLPQGFYLLRVQSANGHSRSVRVAVE